MREKIIKYFYGIKKQKDLWPELSWRKIPVGEGFKDAKIMRLNAFIIDNFNFPSFFVATTKIFIDSLLTKKSWHFRLF